VCGEFRPFGEGLHAGVVERGELGQAEYDRAAGRPEDERRQTEGDQAAAVFVEGAARRTAT
jgi:hypothetical protein